MVNMYTGLILIVFGLLIILLSGCFGLSKNTEPVIIERYCKFAELEEKPSLPEVNWITQGGDCPHYRCIDEENYEKLKLSFATVKARANYVEKVYEGTAETCTE